jgi:hypothetical protein
MSPSDHFQLVARISAHLATLHGEVDEAHYHHHAFGSWWLSFRSKGQVLRLVYDGRDSLLSLERLSNAEPQPWQDAATRRAPDESLESAALDLLGLVTAV